VWGELVVSFFLTEAAPIGFACSSYQFHVIFFLLIDQSDYVPGLPRSDLRFALPGFPSIQS
jgi:hypothetical protein